MGPDFYLLFAITETFIVFDSTDLQRWNGFLLFLLGLNPDL